MKQRSVAVSAHIRDAVKFLKSEGGFSNITEVILSLLQTAKTVGQIDEVLDQRFVSSFGRKKILWADKVFISITSHVNTMIRQLKEQKNLYNFGDAIGYLLKIHEHFQDDIPLAKRAPTAKRKVTRQNYPPANERKMKELCLSGSIDRGNSEEELLVISALAMLSGATTSGNNWNTDDGKDFWYCETN